jgi:hypothetical protein
MVGFARSGVCRKHDFQDSNLLFQWAVALVSQPAARRRLQRPATIPEGQT